MRGRRILRGAACFMAALTLITLALCVSIYRAATDEGLFERSVIRNVDLARLQISESDARHFAAETIAYLRGEASEWAPVVVVGGDPLVISDAFTAHMATVRGWTASVVWILPTGLAVALALIVVVIMGGGSRRGALPMGLWYAGVLVPLAALCGLGLWACLDFNGMWAWLHVSFIPDGIFDAAEPIMKMFPASLFADYIKPVGIAFGVMAGVILLLPLALRPLAARMGRRRV